MEILKNIFTVNQTMKDEILRLDFFGSPHKLLKLISNPKTPSQILEILVDIILFFYKCSDKYFENAAASRSHQDTDNNLAVEKIKPMLCTSYYTKLLLFFGNLVLNLNANDSKNFNPNNLRIIYNAIHNIFIEFPYLVHDLHQIGYSPDLIPYLVENVPSMHISIDFVIEIFKNAPLSRKPFYLKLLRHLTGRYKIDSCFNASMYLINILRDIFRSNF